MLILHTDFLHIHMDIMDSIMDNTETYTTTVIILTCKTITILDINNNTCHIVHITLEHSEIVMF